MTAVQRRTFKSATELPQDDRASPGDAPAAVEVARDEPAEAPGKSPETGAADVTPAPESPLERARAALGGE